MLDRKLLNQMSKILAGFFLCLGISGNLFAQNFSLMPDSATVSVHPQYDAVSPAYKKVFGENYRAEWDQAVKLPVIKISQINGGMKPTELGGGHQSHSLRLIDAQGKEWVLRTVEKFADNLVPKVMRGSLYQDLVDDNFSAQHPFSSLIVPVLAKAVNVPHTNPVIGVVAEDKLLGEYASGFVGKVCLLEEREPLGESKSTEKLLETLAADNTNTIDSATFFRARLLDLLIADWGRHEDQWRWVPNTTSSGTKYTVVPRDRDQALYVNEGIFPKKVASTSGLAFLRGFRPQISNVAAFFFNGRKLNQQFLNQYTHDEWISQTQEFVSALPDSILAKAVYTLPEAAFKLKGDTILKTLKMRRDNLLPAMDEYYRFLYKIVDIRTSDMDEKVILSEADNGFMRISISRKAEVSSASGAMFDNTFDPGITKEIRLFLGKGKDSIESQLKENPIRIRIVGGEGQKNYVFRSGVGKVDIYENKDGDFFDLKGGNASRHLSGDSLQLRKTFSDLYVKSSGLSPTVDLRSVDGIFVGLSYTIKNEGFRKEPYGSIQKLSILKNLNSEAVMLQFESEWKDVFRKTDFELNGMADIKGNIQNYFGRGNETIFDQSGDFRTFYRVKYTYATLNPSLVFRFSPKVKLHAGPALQYFNFSRSDNEGRYINLLQTAESNMAQSRTHLGVVANFNVDTRNERILPSKGLSFNVLAQTFEGLNSSGSAYTQIFPQLSFYKSIGKSGKVVLAERIGGGLSTGHAAFYQDAFLGSQDNLLGYRKFRFTGDNLVYNNLELRITTPNPFRYFMPGRIGLIGFYDAGRVWVKGESSTKIHQGYGGGIFMNPFNKIFVRAIAGFSSEGLQPTVSLKQRF